MQSSILTSDQLHAVNEQFHLDLSYADAIHYRAAQVIYALWKERTPAPKELPNEDTSNEDTSKVDTSSVDTSSEKAIEAEKTN